MKILHIAPHLGGGVGTVICDWMGKVGDTHTIFCLDYINAKAAFVMEKTQHTIFSARPNNFRHEICIKDADIVLVHYWDHPMLMDLFSRPLPDCRLVFWCHKNILYSPREIDFPDVWIDTSPIQGNGPYIWSTGDMSRFLKIKPKKHEGFNVGTVASPKLHPRWLEMCGEIKKVIPEARFTLLGDLPVNWGVNDEYNSIGKVDDVAPYLAEMDVFLYMLRREHYGTAEQALGESMATGVIPVVMNNPCEKEIINNGDNGLIAKNERDAVDCVRFLYNSPNIRSKMSSNARKRAQFLYDINKMIYKWDSVFEELMNEPKRKRDVL
jgi:glycosyltransferase involved in cell wall biosynthesis